MRAIPVYLFLLLTLSVAFYGCHRPDAPEYKGVREVKIRERTDNSVFITAEADFYNPNNYKIILKQANIDVLLNDRKITSFNQDYNLKIEKQSSFTVPLEASFSKDEVNRNVISSALNILLGKKLKVRYEGNIKIKAFGVRIKVPVDGESEIDPKSF